MLTMLLGLRKSSVTIFLYIITTIKVLNENIIKLFYLILIYSSNFGEQRHWSLGAAAICTGCNERFFNKELIYIDIMYSFLLNSVRLTSQFKYQNIFS